MFENCHVLQVLCQDIAETWPRPYRPTTPEITYTLELTSRSVSKQVDIAEWRGRVAWRWRAIACHSHGHMGQPCVNMGTQPTQGPTSRIVCSHAGQEHSRRTNRAGTSPAMLRAAARRILRLPAATAARLSSEQEAQMRLTEERIDPATSSRDPATSS